MTTYSAFTTLDDQTRAQALGEALEALDPAPTGVGVYEMEDGSGLWEVAAYFLEPPDDTGLALLSAAFGARPFTVSDIPETDWVAKVRRDLSPVAAGRFFVFGAHDADKVPAGVIPLRIEAAMAFGTGHHGTTLGCLLATEALLAEGFAPRSVADIGCGTAVLAMAAARVWDAGVIASDIDPVAVEVALSNLAANGLGDRIVCVEAAGLDHPALAQTAPFDLIYANILMGPLLALCPDLFSALAPGGRAILSGLLNEQAADVAGHYVRNGFNLRDERQIGDWTTLIFGR